MIKVGQEVIENLYDLQKILSEQDDPYEMNKFLSDLKSQLVPVSDTTFINPTETTISPEQVSQLEETRGFQSPIRGEWKNSGDFSLTPTDERHLSGHMGVDMRAPAGTPIYPLAPGVVSNVGTGGIGGLFVNIEHDHGIKSYYAHCSTIKVKKGDKVGYDTEIATVGDTGNAKGTPPHLHFQVSKNGQTENPNKYFNVPRYSKVDKNERYWLSEEAKREVENFDVKKFLASKKKASLTSQADYLYKLAHKYYYLSKQ